MNVMQVTSTTYIGVKLEWWLMVCEELPVINTVMHKSKKFNNTCINYSRSFTRFVKTIQFIKRIIGVLIKNIQFVARKNPRKVKPF